MKLLFCIKSMNNSGGGAERVLADVVNSLIERGHKILLLSFDNPNGQSFYKLDPRIERFDLGVGPVNKPATTITTLKRILVMRRIIKEISPDAAIGFMHSMFIPLGFALLATKIPVIASEHIVPKHYESKFLQAILLQLSPFFVKKITCVSEQAKAAYSSFLQKKMVCIPNPVTVQSKYFANVSGESGKRKVLLSIGRLELQKDHETLIEAFAIIVNEVPDWDLKIVGEGSLRAKLEKNIEKNHLKHRVQLAGSTMDVSSEYLAAQLFVNPSRYESFGLTTAEAFAHGLPAIGFEDCLGTNELIRSGFNGELVKVIDKSSRARSLAKSLKSIMLDTGKRNRLAVNAKVPEKYSLGTIVCNWESLISTIKD